MKVGVSDMKKLTIKYAAVIIKTNFNFLCNDVA